MLNYLNQSMKNIIKNIEKVELFCNKILIFLASFFLICMMLLACVNVLFRNMGIPVKGTFELMGFFGAVICGLALARTQKQKQHISVDVLVNLFPKRIQKVLNFIGSFLSLLFFIIVTIQVFKWGTLILRANEVSETLMIVYYPFIYALSLGTLFISVTIFIDILKLGADV